MIDKNIEALVDDFLKIQPHLMPKDKIFEKEIAIQKLIATSVINNIVLSKRIFKKNILIKEFLEKNFSIKLKNYTISSRTLICGKVSRYIYDIEDDEDVINLLNALYNVLKRLEMNENIFDSDIFNVIMGMDL